MQEGEMAYDEKSFDQAVRLAAGFVANGDIRLGTAPHGRDEALLRLQELIGDLHDAVCEARRNKQRELP